LHGRSADASGRAVDQQPCTGGDAELIERTRGGFDRGGQGCCHIEIERRWNRCIEGEHGQLRLGRAVGAEPEGPIADRHVFNAVAELIDDSCGLVSQRLGQRLIHQTPALLPVARVHARRAHGDADLPCARMRIGALDDLQDFRPPERSELNRLHDETRPLSA
jgi:hypothetical protein